MTSLLICDVLFLGAGGFMQSPGQTRLLAGGCVWLNDPALGCLINGLIGRGKFFSRDLVLASDNKFAHFFDHLFHGVLTTEIEGVLAF